MSRLQVIWGKTGPPADCELGLLCVLRSATEVTNPEFCAAPSRGTAHKTLHPPSPGHSAIKELHIRSGLRVQGRTLQSMVCEISSFTTNNQMEVKRQQHVGGVDASL
jgi:hypothetical protein